MRRIFISLIIVLLLCFGAYAGQKSIGNTADALITTGEGYFSGIIVYTDGSDAVTVSLYDNTSASGDKMISTMYFTTSSTDRMQAISFNDEECPYFTGIYADITTSGTVTYDIFFKTK